MFFFNQKTAYEMRISDWCSDVCSSDLLSVKQAMERFRAEYGARIASVIHLVAFFDFSGEDDPRYDLVNVEGTRRLLRALQEFDVEQFVRSAERLVGKECVSRCRSRWAPYTLKKNRHSTV